MAKFARGVFALVRLSLCDVSAIADLASLAIEAGAEVFADGGGITARDVLEASHQAYEVTEAASEVKAAARELQQAKERKLAVNQAERELANAKKELADLEAKYEAEALAKYYQIKIIFDLIDIDGGGSISQKEFEMFLVMFNTVEAVSTDVCARVFALADADNSGEIDLPELYWFLMENESLLKNFQQIAEAIVEAYQSAQADLPKGANEAAIIGLFFRRIRMARRGTPFFSFESQGKYWNRICDPISAGRDGNFYCNRKHGTAAVNFTCSAAGRACRDCVGITTANVANKKFGRKNCPRANHPMRLQGLPNESGTAIYKEGYLCEKCFKSSTELGLLVRWFCIECNDCDVCLNCEPNDCFIVPTMRRCAENHEMQISSASMDGYTCNICSTVIKKCEPKWGCADCDYDMCFPCAAST